MTRGPRLIDEAALDDVVRQATPRAPETLLPKVLAAVAAAEGARRRRRRWMMGVMGGTAGALALAAVVLLVLRTRSPLGPRPSSPPSPWADAGPWRLVAAAGEVLVPGGRAGEPLPPASTVTVAAGGSARLEREGDGGASLLARGLAVLRAEGAALTLLGGTARLGGDGIDVTTVPARIHTIGRDADVELTLQERGDMKNRFLTVKKGGIAAATLGTALLAIHVYRGQAVVERRPGSPPLTLAAGDGALVGASGPPLVLRAPAAEPPAAPAVAAARQERAPAAPGALPPPRGGLVSSSGAARPSSSATEEPRPLQGGIDGALDKEVVRAGIRQIIPQIKACYESALEKTPELHGRLLVKFKIRTQEGKGVVGEGEIQPDSDAALLAAPETGQCILDALVAAEFPAPEDGGEVTVSYPFALMAQPPEDLVEDR
jgi:hypothetical protein